MSRRGSRAAALPLFPDFDFETSLRNFRWDGAATAAGHLDVPIGTGRLVRVGTFTNEYWTSKQRAAHSLHEVSYRACFKPQLPRFFIERLTQPGDIVYDPFMGRGTSVLEAALLGRVGYGCDVNPLSRTLCESRLDPPSIAEVQRGLKAIDFASGDELPEELLVFYHPDTLRQIMALRRHLLERQHAGTLTRADRWIRMVAVNRLTGHSRGFFSVYTLPPNQAVSAKAQAKINTRLNQVPPARDVAAIILSKSRSLLKDMTPALKRQLTRLAPQSQLLTADSSNTQSIADDSVALAVTSPPFLDVVDYNSDNWLRAWFCGIDTGTVAVSVLRQAEAWTAFVTSTLRELRRVVRPGGHVAFEVGEVRSGAVRLEELVIPAAIAAGLDPVLVLINAQVFTKTANCWGVTNNRKGTNTNRVVLLRKG